MSNNTHTFISNYVCVCVVGGAAVSAHDKAFQWSGEGLDDVCQLPSEVWKVGVCPESSSADRSLKSMSKQQRKCRR